jgi:hypothetical protein
VGANPADAAGAAGAAGAADTTGAAPDAGVLAGAEKNPTASSPPSARLFSAAIWPLTMV